MAKKMPKTKMNRKTKRIIRRSLAAVLMITAIGIAAIPATDVEAEIGATPAAVAKREAIVTNAAADADYTGSYAYPASVPGMVIDYEGLSLAPASTGEGHDLYTASLLSDGVTTEIKKGFEFVSRTKTGGATVALISKYINEFAADVVTIPTNGALGFEVVTETMFNDFFAKDSHTTHNDKTNADVSKPAGPGATAFEVKYTDYEYYRGTNTKNQATKDFEKYFKTEFDGYWDLCSQKYEATLLHDAWALLPVEERGAEPVIPTVSDSLQIIPSDLDYELKKKFYCDYNFGSSGENLTLEWVNDRIGYYEYDGSVGATVSTSVMHRVYAVSTKNGTVYDPSKNYNGFLVTDVSPTIVGICDSVFEEVKNVDEIIIPNEISYIGDRAFYHSFIKKITLTNVEKIGNEVFKTCPYLNTVNILDGTSIIGNECFADSTVPSIKLPASITVIGKGAFKNCKELTSVDMGEIVNGEILDYAFYDCYNLSNVVFPESGLFHIGEAAFAVGSEPSGNWTNIVLPRSIYKKYDGTNEGLGNFLFAGRNNLRSVTFPVNYCKDAKSDDDSTGKTYNTIPAGMFRGCTNLAEIIFPDSCRYAKYEPYTFLDVINPDFLVRGPGKKNDGDPAKPRTSTWKAVTQVSDFVPYVYINDAGVECYEVSNGEYILQVEPDGTLTSVTLVDDSTTDIDMVIPSKVGDYKVTNIASDCFKNEKIRNEIKTLTIEDDTVSEIAAECFSKMPKLESLYVGNSVKTIGDKAFYDCNKLKTVVIENGTQSIGNSAFENCDLLENVSIGNAITHLGDRVFYDCPTITDISFASPKDGYSALVVGTDAFKTNGTKLTLHGDIQGGYALFDWATDPSNMIDELGTRVCYMSPSPTYLRVIYNNNTGDITLVDYPKFNKLDTDHADHNTAMEKFFYKQYADPAYDDLRTAFQTAFDACTTDEERTAVYNSDNYGPWVNSNYVTLTSWSGGVTPDAYFAHAGNAYSIIDNYNNPDPRGDWESTTLEEEAWINATQNIVVPQGVTSIDVYDYIKGSSKNQQNVQKYIKTLPGYNMYTSDEIDTSTDPEVKCVPGLFSGMYDDYPANSQDEKDYEKAKRGNDSVRSITLNSVKKLPDYCFDSCERLTSVVLGPELTDISTAPFRGCDQLQVVGGNDNFVYDNGIIYSVNDDGKDGETTYTIEECLSSRGNAIGTGLLNGLNDKNLEHVTQIKEGAFEECNFISNVDLTPASKLTEIPEKAFRNCKMLSFVTLPESVNSIKTDAFADDAPISVTIPGIEVHIATDAFDLAHAPMVNIRTYEDSAALEYAKYHKLSYELIADKYRVQFYDYDGTELCDPQYVVSGGNATPPEDPKREGYTFTGWSASYISVTKDTTCIAQYKGGSGDDDPSKKDDPSQKDDPPKKDDPSKDDPSKDGNFYSVTVINGSGSGAYKAGSTITIVANANNGRNFSNWSSNDGVAFANSTAGTTTFVMPAKNVTVTAYYTTSGSISGNSNASNKTNQAGSLGTRVTINKPGISNTNLASAKVNGSNDDFIVKISETAEATAAVERALTNEYGSLDNLQYFAMDITLWDSNGATKITDTTGISIDITIPIPDMLKTYAGNNKTASVVNDNLEPLTPKFTTIDNVPCVTFRATHFSPYCVYVDTTNLTAGTQSDATPKTADGIHPKWFLAIGLAALSMILFFKKDRVKVKTI